MLFIARGSEGGSRRTPAYASTLNSVRLYSPTPSTPHRQFLGRSRTPPLFLFCCVGHSVLIPCSSLNDFARRIISIIIISNLNRASQLCRNRLCCGGLFTVPEDRRVLRVQSTDLRDCRANHNCVSTLHSACAEKQVPSGYCVWTLLLSATVCYVTDGWAQSAG